MVGNGGQGIGGKRTGYSGKGPLRVILAVVGLEEKWHKICNVASYFAIEKVKKGLQEWGIGGERSVFSLSYVLVGRSKADELSGC